jgi:hypothetical protein
MQMIQHASLVRGDDLSRFIFAQMPAMARKENGRIGIKQSSDSWIHGRGEIVASGLMCQTNCLRDAKVFPR